MRPEDFNSGRPTVNPTTRRLYAYGQMLFGGLVGTATVVGAVYAFLGKYVTDEDLHRAFRDNNSDLVEKGQELPHNVRFLKIEAEEKSLRDNINDHAVLLGKLSATDTLTLEVLAGCIASEKSVTTHPAITCGNYHYYLSSGETPIEAFRHALATTTSVVPGRR